MKSKKLKVVYFTFIGIHADNNGGYICCRNHIKRLSSDTGIELFVVAVGTQEQKEASLEYLKSLGVSGTFVVYRDLKEMPRPKLRRRIAPIPMELIAKFQNHIDQEVLDTIVKMDADVLVVEYLYSALLCPKAIKAAPRSILITQNRETEFYRETLKRNDKVWVPQNMKLASIRKIIILMRVWLFERSMLKTFDRIIALGLPDLPKRKGHFITPYLDSKEKQWKPNSSRSILFIGDIQHYPNNEAIQYIVCKLATAVAALLPDVRFKIIGASSDDVSIKHPSVDFMGKANNKEVEHQFLNCQLFICPVANTFGMKFKMAEALSYGTPFLASPESMLCVPYLSDQPTLPLDDPSLAAKNIAAVIENEAASAQLASKITSRHLEFIKSQKNIWSSVLNQT